MIDDGSEIDLGSVIEVLQYTSGCHTDNPATVKILLNARLITTIEPIYSFGYPTFYEIRFGGTQRVVVNEDDYERVCKAMIRGQT